LLASCGRVRRHCFRRHQRVVDLAGVDGGRAGAEALPVALERRALLDRAELHAEAEMRADVDVGRGEGVAASPLEYAATDRALGFAVPLQRADDRLRPLRFLRQPPEVKLHIGIFGYGGCGAACSREW
jgi:hypothetical protein